MARPPVYCSRAFELCAENKLVGHTVHSHQTTGQFFSRAEAQTPDVLLINLHDRVASLNTEEKLISESMQMIIER